MPKYAENSSFYLCISDNHYQEYLRTYKWNSRIFDGFESNPSHGFYWLQNFEAHNKIDKIETGFAGGSRDCLD